MEQAAALATADVLRGEVAGAQELSERRQAELMTVKAEKHSVQARLAAVQEELHSEQRKAATLGLRLGHSRQALRHLQAAGADSPDAGMPCDAPDTDSEECASSSAMHGGLQQPQQEAPESADESAGADGRQAEQALWAARDEQAALLAQAEELCSNAESRALQLSGHVEDMQADRDHARVLFRQALAECAASRVRAAQERAAPRRQPAALAGGTEQQQAELTGQQHAGREPMPAEPVSSAGSMTVQEGLPDSEADAEDITRLEAMCRCAPTPRIVMVPALPAMVQVIPQVNFACQYHKHGREPPWQRFHCGTTLMQACKVGWLRLQGPERGAGGARGGGRAPAVARSAAGARQGTPAGRGPERAGAERAAGRPEPPLPGRARCSTPRPLMGDCNGQAPAANGGAPALPAA